MVVWNWLKEINLMNTACIMTNESNRRFCDSDYKKQLPQKLLKPFLTNIIETHYIDVFIVPIYTKFQLAAGNVLSQLKKKYPHIKIVVITFSDLNSDFDLRSIWGLRNSAYKHIDAEKYDDKPCDQIKKEIIEYIYSLDTVVITEDLDIGSFNQYWRLERFKENIENPIQTDNSICNLQSGEYLANTDNGLFKTDDSNNENTHERRRQIKRIKRKILSQSKKIQVLSQQLAIENALLEDYKAELQRLEGTKTDSDDKSELEIEAENTINEPQTKSEHKTERDIHAGLYDKYVLWPVGYCHNHNCALDEIDLIKRKCILRRGRNGICYHFEFIDENGNTIHFDKSLFANRTSYADDHRYIANCEASEIDLNCCGED